MQVAGHTYAFRDRPLQEALGALAALGLGQVEVWLGHSSGDPGAVVAALDAYGLQAAAVSAGGYYREESDVPARAFQLAVAVHAPVVVICVAPRLAAALAASVPSGITVCVENHWDQPLARPDEVARALNSGPRLAACLDTGHAILAGVRPERFVRRLGPRLGHIHLKEARTPRLPVRLLGRRLRKRLLARPAPVALGRGNLDLRTLRDALSAAGFDGTVSLEHEGTEPDAALRRLLTDWQSVAEEG